MCAVTAFIKMATGAAKGKEVADASPAFSTPSVRAKRDSIMLRMVTEADESALQAMDAESLMKQQVADMDGVVATQTIALVAHDNMKKLMRQFVEVHLEQLRDFQLTGTGTTCKMLREIGLEPVGSTASGPLGGDQQIGAMVVEGRVDAIFFFRDPLSAHPHHADIEALGRLADCFQIYFASNYRSSAAILSFMHHTHRAHLETGARMSVKKPNGIDNLAEYTQDEYKKTRAKALESAAAAAPAASPAARGVAHPVWVHRVDVRR